MRSPKILSQVFLFPFFFSLSLSFTSLATTHFLAGGHVVCLFFVLSLALALSLFSTSV